MIEEIKLENKKDSMTILPSKKKLKAWLVFLVLGIVFIVSGIICLLISFLKPEDEKVAHTFPTIPSHVEEGEVYSDLTGEVLASAELKTAPTYCIQTPNGTDGARPQVGLTEAGVVFEAIAEAGITRFAAIYQNPKSAVIGPIRSLRIYYLEWDTPFDCTIVHAGGAYNALLAVQNGGYRDLTENYDYMYRGTAGTRLWNNLFTTAEDLNKFASDKGYTTSSVKGFSRLTPTEARRVQVDSLATERLEITAPTEKNTSELVAKTPEIGLRFGGTGTYNVKYRYDLETNTYFRSYANGSAHEVYKCPDENLGEVNPEAKCSLVQMNPAVVVAIVVQEGKDSDGYHEKITTTGSGEAYIFQNGVAIRGTWNKASKEDQFKFYDENGAEVSLAPGQTFISAIPGYGGVDY